MARRRLLGDDLWSRLLDPPREEREIVRHYTLSPDDHALVALRRGDANRLGYALVLLYLRFPGRVLEAGEKPSKAVLSYVSDQLGVSPSSFDRYALRDATGVVCGRV